MVERVGTRKIHHSGAKIGDSDGSRNPIRASKHMSDSKTEVLGEDIGKRYRSCVMRAAYLAEDNPVMSEAVNSLRWILPDAEETGRVLIEYPMKQMMKETSRPFTTKVVQFAR